MSRISYLLATGFFTGYSPVAPGTAGTALMLVICWFFLPIPLWLHIVLILIVFFVGVRASLPVIAEHGEDPSLVVIDEMAGMLIALFAVPVTLPSFLAAFLAFRIFDVVKPFPVNRAESLPSGWGVMMDDVVAGLYALLVVHLLHQTAIL